MISKKLLRLVIQLYSVNKFSGTAMHDRSIVSCWMCIAHNEKRLHVSSARRIYCKCIDQTTTTGTCILQTTLAPTEGSYGKIISCIGRIHINHRIQCINYSLGKI